MAKRIVVVGSLNVDFVLALDRFPAPGETVPGRDFNLFPGGKGANQAYGAARLGGQVSMVGQVGHDTHATWLKQHLAAGGVDVAHVTADATVTTGVAVIGVEAGGQNRIVVVPGANGTLGTSQLAALPSMLAPGDLLLLQLEVPLETVTAAARLARAAGATIILDPAPALPLGRELLACADYVTPNETELAALTGSPAKTLSREEAATQAAQLRALGAARVIVKLGAAGALLLSAAGEHFWPALPVEAVDTTAAGDAFNAAFACALSTGQSEIEAGRFAVAAAACSVTRRGAQPSMPTRAEVDELLRQRGT
ncbi:MAG: ribokinase [Planctomycetia bacterium]|nr:ribokinase [Planctomycetia bacterium]